LIEGIVIASDLLPARTAKSASDDAPQAAVDLNGRARARQVPAGTATDAVAADFRLLGDPTRLAILQELRRGECCVCDLVDLLGIAQPLLSHHLKALREGGFVADRKSGKWVYYMLVPIRVLRLQETLGALVVTKVPRRRDCTP
jgi:ArsR family transcriptional regulator